MLGYLIIALFIAFVILNIIIVVKVFEVKKQSISLSEINKEIQQELAKLKEKLDSVEKILKNIE